MSDLPEFLLARITEDDLFWETVGDWGQAHPDRVKRYRADCAAKRRIVEGMHDDRIDDINAPEVLGLLALPYVDHPDYREEWKP